jgi:hypothetical protein
VAIKDCFEYVSNNGCWGKSECGVMTMQYSELPDVRANPNLSAPLFEVLNSKVESGGASNRVASIPLFNSAGNAARASIRPGASTQQHLGLTSALKLTPSTLWMMNFLSSGAA